MTLQRVFPYLLVCGYAAMAVLVKPPGNLPELFPFFSWSLFSTSSDHRTDVTLRVRSVDGRPLAEPTLFYHLKDTFAAARDKDPRLMKLLDRLAVAIRSADTRTADHLREVVELTFMREVAAIDYDLVLVSYNPIERLRSGAIDSVQVVASFKKTSQ